MTDVDRRPDPDVLLATLGKKEDRAKGELKIFFGYAAGVGKTYAMLDEAGELLKNGVDVLVGYVEPHTRPETMELMEGLPVLSPLSVSYKNIRLQEFDLASALERKPEVILVDELAHSNVEGVRNRKRYQDVEELLNAGIDVYTTVNVQHIESLNDVVRDITNVNVFETIPDYFFDHAEKIKLIDIEPDELLRRFEGGKVYRPERVATALHNFFTYENLCLLRELAVRKIADRISHENMNERGLTEKPAGIKMLVCVGPSPSSAKCIRWTARTAEAFRAPWVAVHVERMDDERLPEGERKSIRANLDLAERLGAEIATLNGDDIAAVVAEYVKLSGVTNIVVGKGRNKRTLKNFYEKDFEDRLIALLPNVEVHIIPGRLPGKTYRPPRRRYMGRDFFFSWWDFLKTVFLLTAATLLSTGFRAFGIGDHNIIMLYILSVLVVSRVTDGYFYGIVASIASVLAFNFFFTVPYFTFYTIQPGYPVTFVIMLVVALITSALTLRIKAQMRYAVERVHRVEVLYEINKKLLAARGIENIVSIANEYLVKIFNRSAVFYTLGSDGSLAGSFLKYPSEARASSLMLDEERAVAHWVFTNQKHAGAGTDTLMGARGLYIPVVSQGKVLGVIGVSCVEGLLDQGGRLFLSAITSQVAMALERQLLSDEQRKMTISSEKEKMRSNLLRAISHDLRTPLTGIWGASSTILENDLDISTRNKLIAHIREESQWLIRMVENLLSVTRINEDATSVIKTCEAVEEVVAEAVGRIRKRFPGRKIAVKAPDELLMVPMDGTLVEQVLINLMENAVNHSSEDAKVEVKIYKNEGYAFFEVIDSGEGIPEEILPNLFESYIPDARRGADSSRGMGIGLTVCMTIVKAHRGKMEAFNKSEGHGAVFRFMLPLKERCDDADQTADPDR